MFQSQPVYYILLLTQTKMEIKIHNGERNRKRETQKGLQNHLTPPKYLDKSSVCNTVNRWTKKFGYESIAFTEGDADNNRKLHNMKYEFMNKAVKYCGNGVFAKKQTRFDKMRLKEEIGFKLEEMPIKKQLRRADFIITMLMKKQAMYALHRCK